MQTYINRIKEVYPDFQINQIVENQFGQNNNVI